MSQVFETEKLTAPSEAGKGGSVAALSERRTRAAVRDRRYKGNQNPGAARRVSVLKGYQLWAQTYDRDPNPLLALEERELERLLPNLTGKDVIDVACGTGRWLRKLLSGGARSGVGADFSAAMLKAANTEASLQGHLVRGDCLALPFRPQVADLLICSFVLGHLRDLPAFAHELARVARRHAEVFVSDLHPQGYARGWRCAFRYAEQAVEIPSHAHSLDQILRAFESEGFELVRLNEPFLGEAEKRIFVQTRKSHLFGAACQTPAVFICHFKLVDSRSVNEVSREVHLVSK